MTEHEEKRSGSPGRRFYDKMSCVFHEGVCNRVSRLEAKDDIQVNKIDFDTLKGLVESKLDRWVFVLFVSSISIVMVITSSLFGWLAVNTIKTTQKVAIIELNQIKLLKYFDIIPIKDEDH